MEAIARGVLDTPPARGMTVFVSCGCRLLRYLTIKIGTIRDNFAPANE
jgi:hypothetical protein